MRHAASPSLDRALSVAHRLFDDLHAIGFDGRGMTRPSYGRRETAAHDLIEATARAHGLEVRRDWAANLLVTYPGRDRYLPAVMTGSHLDTVPCGGNFDGAAGVLAGLAVLLAWQMEGCRPLRDTTLIVIRAEESAWFPLSYVGSRAAFGLLGPQDMQTPRIDNGKSLAEHIRDAGGDPDVFAEPSRHLDPGSIDSFVELHIEQGPILIDREIPVAIVGGICGSFRFRRARIIGRGAHSGATPRGFRADAAVAASRLVIALDELWARYDADGQEMTVTVGVLRTPDDAHFSAVAAQVDLAIDVRAHDPALLDAAEREIRALAASIAETSGVTIDLGERTGSIPAIMDPTLLSMAELAASESSVDPWVMRSGAGHDAAVFAGRSVPTLMLFVRNQNGSHNPDEAMELTDFDEGVLVLERLLRRRADRSAVTEA